MNGLGDVVTASREVIAAFVDGERVDVEALKRALADEAGRDHLVDLVALRELVREPQPAPARVGVWSRRALWIGAAAALVAVAAGGTFYVASRFADRPPRPDHVVTLERGRDWRGN